MFNRTGGDWHDPAPVKTSDWVADVAAMRTRKTFAKVPPHALA